MPCIALCTVFDFPWYTISHPFIEVTCILISCSIYRIFCASQRHRICRIDVSSAYLWTWCVIWTRWPEHGQECHLTCIQIIILYASQRYKRTVKFHTIGYATFFGLFLLYFSWFLVGLNYSYFTYFVLVLHILLFGMATCLFYGKYTHKYKYIWVFYRL